MLGPPRRALPALRGTYSMRPEYHIGQLDRNRYNEVVAESLKVPKDQFEAAIRALLNTAPSPLADIPRKREPKAKRTKKRS